MENTYHYDLNGNNLSGAGRSMAYTVFSKPYQIQSAQGSTHFWYDSERNRFKREDVGERYEYYIGNVEVLKENGRTIYRRNVGSTILRFDPLVDLDVQHSQRSQVITDHLGSTVAVHTPTPLSPWQYQSFEPFGNKLHQSAPSQMIGLITHWTDRGFTGHEGVDKAGIIHMNGRIYDPAMGRFLQADPFIQEPDNTQSLNRYSYVINNPLSYTDPSGYFVNNLFSAAFQGVLTAAGCTLGTYIGCGVASFVANIALGQTLRQSTINGAVSGVQSVAFDKIGALHKTGDIDSYTAFALHAALGAAGAAAQGGDVVASLLTAGVSKAFSLSTKDFLAGLGEDAVQVLSVAIVGGTVSALTGGKFGNGAFLAGFAYAINQLQALAMAANATATRFTPIAQGSTVNLSPIIDPSNPNGFMTEEEAARAFQKKNQSTIDQVNAQGGLELVGAIIYDGKQSSYFYTDYAIVIKDSFNFTLQLQKTTGVTITYLSAIAHSHPNDGGFIFSPGDGRFLLGINGSRNKNSIPPPINYYLIAPDRSLLKLTNEQVKNARRGQSISRRDAQPFNGSVICPKESFC